MNNEIKKEDQNLTEVQKSSSKVLAAQVVAYRLIKNSDLKQKAIECMDELSKRKLLGDEFDFEEYIKKNIDIELPEKIDLNEIFSIFKNAKL